MLIDTAPWASEQQRIVAINALADAALFSLPSGVMTKTVPVELIDRLRGWDSGYWAGALPPEVIKDLRDAADALAAAPSNAAPQDNHAPEAASETRMAPAGVAPSAEGWIPVSERLPEFPDGKNSVRCICYTGNFVTSLEWCRNVYAKTERGKAPRWEWDGRISPWIVTHWKPLPKPPLKPKEGGAG